MEPVRRTAPRVRPSQLIAQHYQARARSKARTHGTRARALLPKFAQMEPVRCTAPRARPGKLTQQHQQAGARSTTRNAREISESATSDIRPNGAGPLHSAWGAPRRTDNAASASERPQQSAERAGIEREGYFGNSPKWDRSVAQRLWLAQANCMRSSDQREPSAERGTY